VLPTGVDRQRNPEGRFPALVGYAAGDAGPILENDITWQQNMGDTLLQWPDRAKSASQLIKKLPLKNGSSLADIGCGQQTLRSLIPSEIKYYPIDKLQRSQDTIVLDLNEETPNQQFTITVMLGVLEYLNSPETMLKYCVNNSEYLIFSFNDCSDPQRSEPQHWKSRWSLQDINREVVNIGGQIKQVIDLGSKELLFLVTGRKNKKKLALFSAAVDGDNSGDAIIVDAIKRILSGNEILEFPLLKSFGEEELKQINNCDMGIICGTNLYQNVFACALTPETLNKLRLPILPLGVGSSAPIGQIPQMNPDGIKAVKMLHEKCAISSVRDPMSYKFVRTLGIKNVELTGCPVLFHGLAEPEFNQNYFLNSRIQLSIRARLLHVEENWLEKEIKTLELISQRYNPTIILQSPYDLPIAQALSQKYHLKFVLDERYSHEILVKNIKTATRTIGFRLHFGMLGLGYGKPATFIATDTRISSFCEMMGIKFHNIKSYDDKEIISELSSPLPGMEKFIQNWRNLRSAMREVLTANDLLHIL
jgi:polysaccharide pyruvyl transferase WcaK-like protein